MKVKVPVLVKDPEVAKYKDINLTQPFTIENEDFFLDGPITRRVAMIDFDPQTGGIVPGARLRPATNGGVAEYELRDQQNLEDPAFMQVTTFGGVYKTVSMFEEQDTLGRRVRWAFPGNQLLVVPRAGEWANAFYERNSRSIQLFYLTNANGRRVYTCHSQDIISHETAHAVIDGVAPDLYHATSPDGLALHESLADIATLMMAFRSRELAATILRNSGGSLERPNVFTEVAEQFGSALQKSGHELRNLRNDKTISSLGSNRDEPHALSEVLSGALYSVMVEIYEDLRKVAEDVAMPSGSLASMAEFKQWAESEDPSSRSFRRGEKRDVSSGRALFIASERFKRTVLRALDYLPPGEVSFADYGRSIIASDQASHPESHEQRDWLKQQFVNRGIARRFEDLDVKTSYDHPAVSALDLDALVESDWLAYQFADKQRSLLGIPRKIPFEVRPRLVVKKKYYHRDSDQPSELQECLFKVAWTETEPNRVGGGLPTKRRIIRGTTLAIDWKTMQVRAVVTGEPGAQKEMRDAFITRLLDNDLIRLEGAGSRGVTPRNAVGGQIVNGTLRLHGTAHALHIARSAGYDG